MRAITAITYQALYSAMKHDKGELKDQEEEEGEETESMASEETEEVDFREFDILAAVKEAGVKTICLDEGASSAQRVVEGAGSLYERDEGNDGDRPDCHAAPMTARRHSGSATRTCAVRSMRRSLRRNWCGKEASVRMRTTSVSTGRPRRN